ncbi:MAG: mycothiol system anti-sigma-R factor [Pseudoclavibacter sp.]|nr:mycothiol system anti-sigma-R factor [Pseudoclavibacter sp.]
MSGRECELALLALEEYLHDELGAEQAARIRAHLEECPPCMQELLVNEKLMELVRRSCRERAPEHLRMRIIEAIDRSVSG